MDYIGWINPAEVTAPAASVLSIYLKYYSFYIPLRIIEKWIKLKFIVLLSQGPRQVSWLLPG
jgi:hypothetical protein